MGYQVSNDIEGVIRYVFDDIDDTGFILLKLSNFIDLTDIKKYEVKIKLSQTPDKRFGATYTHHTTPYNLNKYIDIDESSLNDYMETMFKQYAIKCYIENLPESEKEQVKGKEFKWTCKYKDRYWETFNNYVKLVKNKLLYRFFKIYIKWNIELVNSNKGLIYIDSDSKNLDPDEVWAKSSKYYKEYYKLKILDIYIDDLQNYIEEKILDKKDDLEKGCSVGKDYSDGFYRSEFSNYGKALYEAMLPYNLERVFIGSARSDTLVINNGIISMRFSINSSADFTDDTYINGNKKKYQKPQQHLDYSQLVNKLNSMLSKDAIINLCKFRIGYYMYKKSNSKKQMKPSEQILPFNYYEISRVTFTRDYQLEIIMDIKKDIREQLQT